MGSPKHPVPVIPGFASTPEGTTDVDLSRPLSTMNFGLHRRLGFRSGTGDIGVGTVLGIAENLHDSCLTVIQNGIVTVHVELERVLRKKRAVFSTGGQVASLVSWLERCHDVPSPDVIGVVRHAVEPVTEQAIGALTQSHPGVPILRYDHLDCHAALAALSGLPEADVVALDGGGDRRVVWGQPNALIRRWESGSLGEPQLLGVDQLPIDGRSWAVLSYALFQDLHAAGKVMGLAAYGQPDEQASEAIRELVAESLIWRYDEETLARFAQRFSRLDFTGRANSAYALQEAFSQAMVGLAQSEATANSSGLVLTGGCALNVTTNAQLAALGEGRRKVWVPPCPGDEGISLGAAILAAADSGQPVEHAAFPYLGLGQNVCLPEQEIRKTAEAIARGGVVAVAVGRGEAGPRALGHRSFVALPTLLNKRRVSEAMKGREAFRPVAPAVRAIDARDWLETPYDSAFMSFSSMATERLREECPGVVHVDGTARHQTVTHETHPTLARLLDQVATLGLAPVLINTSLNTAGVPIALDASDGLSTALTTGADGILTDVGFVKLS